MDKEIKIVRFATFWMELKLFLTNMLWYLPKCYFWFILSFNNNNNSFHAVDVRIDRNSWFSSTCGYFPCMLSLSKNKWGAASVISSSVITKGFSYFRINAPSGRGAFIRSNTVFFRNFSNPTFFYFLIRGTTKRKGNRVLREPTHNRRKKKKKRKRKKFLHPTLNFHNLFLKFKVRFFNFPIVEKIYILR